MISDTFSFSQIRRDFAELFAGGFKVCDDFLCENIGIGEIIGILDALVSEPYDVDAGLSRLRPD